jgi:hypothetical protein
MFFIPSLSQKAVGPGGTNGRDKVLYFVTKNLEVNVYRGIYNSPQSLYIGSAQYYSLRRREIRSQ